MRTFALLSTMALFGLASAAPFSLEVANTPVVEFAESLQCAGCIRGGYTLCGKSKSGTVCVKPDNTTGIKDLQDQGYNCDNGIKGAIGYYAYDVCVEFNNEGCGSKGVESMIVDLPDNKTNVTRNVFLEYSQGCGYRVVSKCGFPQLNITSYDYDVTVALHEDKTVEGDPVVNYEFADNETLSMDYQAGKNEPFLYKYPGNDDNSTFNCSNPDNKIRKMYVLITNLQKPAEPKPQSFLEEEARVLQGVKKTYVNGTLTFSAVAGAVPKSAFALFSSVAVALFALFSVIAF